MTHLAIFIAALALQAAPDPPLTSDAYLAEVARYLYRWHLDESDVQPEAARGEFVFWVRMRTRELDEGDNSRLAEITLPRIGVRVGVKKADYSIPELGIEVRNDRPMVTDVLRTEPIDGPPPEGTTEVRMDYAALRDLLFKTRNTLQPPGDKMLDQMRLAARAEFRKFSETRDLPLPTQPQTIHLAPLSPVANEAWVFWEDARMLLRFHSDIDLDEQTVWDHQDLSVDLFDLNEQVVVSLDEVAGSNAYVTRDMVGRCLYNCVVLGRKVVLQPPPPDED